MLAPRVLGLFLSVPFVAAVGGGGPARVAAQPGAAGRTVEEVLAVVGDKPILRTELEERLEAALLQLRVDPADTAGVRQLREGVLTQLIDEELVRQEAIANGIAVTPEEVGAHVERLIAEAIEATGGREGFEAQLQREGLTETQLRAQYTEQIQREALSTRWIERECRPRPDVTDAEVQQFFTEKQADLPPRPRALHVADVFVLVKPDSVLEERTRARAAEVRRLIEGGLDFAQAAREHSDADDAARGGELERFATGELDPIFAGAVRDLPLGQVSEPVRSLFGYHLLAVRARDPEGEWVDLSHILFELEPSRTDEARAIDRATAIRGQILSGEVSFDTAVERYSEDAEAKARGGDLGWIPMNQFYGAVRATMDTLRVGRISRPVPADGGVHVFKLLGEEAERAYRFDEIKDDLRQMASRAAIDRQIRACLDELRKKHYVEIRSEP